MTDSIQSQILSLIPSHSLKKQLNLSTVHFSDEDLLTIAYRYAPDYETRIALLQKLEQSFSDELKEYTSRLISVQKQMLEISRTASGFSFMNSTIRKMTEEKKPLFFSVTAIRI